MNARVALRLLSLSLALLLAGCQALMPAEAPPVEIPPAAVPAQPATPVASPAGPVSPSWTGRPRLLVLLVVDGLPQRQVLAYRDQLAPDGFNRFLQQGAWYADAHYGHAYTVTAAGHAAVLTGAYPHRTGIIANEWRDAMSGQPTYCTGDLAAVYIGHKTQLLDGTSPQPGS